MKKWRSSYHFRDFGCMTWRSSLITLPKTNMDNRNDGLEKVTIFKHGVIFGIYVRFLGCIFVWFCLTLVKDICNFPFQLDSLISFLLVQTIILITHLCFEKTTHMSNKQKSGHCFLCILKKACELQMSKKIVEVGVVGSCYLWGLKLTVERSTGGNVLRVNPYAIAFLTIAEVGLCVLVVSFQRIKDLCLVSLVSCSLGVCWGSYHFHKYQCLSYQRHTKCRPKAEWN